ncbi:molybdenum cofactor biosynthesis protein MoaE [Robertkochia solimangrovi]|uniref:molybdenum cofactor biosynthesis protein MoaE n=1 Tax=Robertkochia solimangrovi TaxID=2213046 RepID=UPI00117FCA3F|nr:molybdenum cofactor biosynthesis protein MoaE [Robertkochia solimangrovi]TRZ42226.1 molybdenum cofactor biosynthesis protein MoaE [Robertkochia solimangrovi]
MKKTFIQGGIPPEVITKSITDHQSKTGIGAHSIFLGQIRADDIEGKIVKAIEYTAYEEMAEKVFHEIREAAFEKFELTCAHIYHSLGVVNVGEICLFVFTSSKRRKIAIEATEYFVEEIKAKVPIFGKEVFSDESYQWKVNT